MTDVEIFWPDTLPTDALFEAESVLREAGVTATSRLQRTRRGVELSILVYITTTALEPLFSALFERVGEQAFRSLRDFVTRLLGNDKEKPAGRSVLFRSSSTGAQFVFTSNLPEEAFRQAVELDPGDSPGEWVWDHASSRWLQFRTSN